MSNRQLIIFRRILKEREREKKKETKKDRDKDRDKKRQRQKQRQRERQRQRQKQRERIRDYKAHHLTQSIISNSCIVLLECSLSQNSLIVL